MPRDHGKLKDGTPITDEMVGDMADEAERGYDVDDLQRRRVGGRPAMGSGPASVESVRLDRNSRSGCFCVPRRTASPCPTSFERPSAATFAPADPLAPVSRGSGAFFAPAAACGAVPHSKNGCARRMR